MFEMDIFYRTQIDIRQKTVYESADAEVMEIRVFYVK